MENFAKFSSAAFVIGALQQRRLSLANKKTIFSGTGPRSAVGNVSGNRCESDCRSRGSWIRFRPDPILSWRLIMKSYLRSFSSLPLNHSRRAVASCKSKYVHAVLVNCVCSSSPLLGELTVPPWPKQTKTKSFQCFQLVNYLHAG